MQGLYSRLSEKSRRSYAGVEALKLPHGGASYIAQLFGCPRDTVVRGIKPKHYSGQPSTDKRADRQRLHKGGVKGGRLHSCLIKRMQQAEKWRQDLKNPCALFSINTLGSGTIPPSLKRRL